ncbi:hypothetical protein Vqi01_00140 [Micromonospora qiuiae]|uniref:Uncharacterized protein n=1 Tax=Micromonospora qiuiae TaxID=502268 RepID=A0ABQ4J3V0_9ACTN|nr:hypothetical protein [Micromonospora qiuiae]GIJ24852.1 hypothetical protein Vqi01_00140 [Micromonospora qiuiae]
MIVLPDALRDTHRVSEEQPSAAGAPPAAASPSDQKANNPEPAKESPWWKNPAIAVPAIIGIIGVVVSAYLALNPRAAPEVDNATLCREKHSDAREVPVEAEGQSPSRFSGCVWPPVLGADPDGYWTVQVREFEIPGSYAAQKFTTIQVFSTSCFALTLDYRFLSQGTVAHSRFTVDTVQTVSGYDGQVLNLYAEVPDPPQEVLQAQDTHLIVLINSRYTLHRVRCTDSDAEE